VPHPEQLGDLLAADLRVPVEVGEDELTVFAER
jgi:hypothetical protein